MKEKRIKSNKIKKQEMKEKRFLQEKRDQAARLKPQPKVYILANKIRNPLHILNDIFAGKPVEGYPVLQAELSVIPEQRELTRRILFHFIEEGIQVDETKDSLQTLIRLAKYPDKVIREVETWKPKTYNLQRQIASFSRHLYAKYFIPTFMDSVWYSETKFQPWFLHIGQGNNIRTASQLPVTLTKKEAHYFLQAPADFTPLQAIRYGQILNLGGKEPLVRQVLRTRIAVDFIRDEFCLSVFRWLLKHPMLDTAQYAPIIDYIFHQKYMPSRLDSNGNMVCQQPNLSMKDRDPETTLRQVEAWHKKLGKEKGEKNLVWASSGIKSYSYKSSDKKTLYTIDEICTQKELITEGRTMKHCVGSYAHSCHSGRISIWRFEELGQNGLDKRLTIEVDNKEGKITQARGKYNALPNQSDLYHLRNWANEAKLIISKWIN